MYSDDSVDPERIEIILLRNNMSGCGSIGLNVVTIKITMP